MIRAMVGFGENQTMELDLEFMVFSGGENHVKIKNVDQIPQFIRSASIYAYICSADALVTTLLLADAIKRLPSFLNGVTILTLELPYTPGARQDRVCEPGEAFSADVYTKIINSVGFNSVVVEDPHSDVSTALLKNVQTISQDELVVSMLGQHIENENMVLISPDAGAQKKILKLSQALGGVDVVKADKIRDTKTGKITGTDVYGDVSGRKVLIVDDILDGGGTFIPLAQKLKEKGATQVDLYITHGIFSKGVDIFDGVIDNIYTRNTWSGNVEGRNEKGILKDAPNK